MNLFSKGKAGFSLIELMVVLAIIAVVSSVVLTSASRFDKSVVLTNLAYQVALTIREAQMAGVNVRAFENSGSQTFDVGYGVHFYSENSDGSRNTTGYIMFADILDENGQGDYEYNGDESGGAEFVSKYLTGRGNTIEKFCGKLGGTSEVCSKTSGFDYLNVVFVRPNPEANFVSSLGAPFRSVIIYIKAPDGSRRTVEIESTGQISVCGPEGC